MKELTLREHMRRCGLASAAKLTPEQRKERGRQAAAKRWSKTVKLSETFQSNT